MPDAAPKAPARREVTDASGRRVAWDLSVRPDHQGAGFGASMEPGRHAHPEALAVVFGGRGAPCPWCDGRLFEVDGRYLARCDADPSHAVEFLPWPG
jgi:hypothetical protein